jgi:branched-subunit amino acid ABC-type transport system permease component
LGALLYLSAVALWVAIAALSGHLAPDLVDLAFVGTMAAAALACAAGGVGARLALRGSARTGALLMLVAALAVAAALFTQPFLVDAAGDRGLRERIRDDQEPSLTDQPLARILPSGAMLVGAALALLAPGAAATRNRGRTW